jgi:osmotically-inducible protein OsmY
MPADPNIDHDLRLTEALTRFVRNVAGDDASVVCTDGVAVLHGRVESLTQARALTDLVRWHEGVRDVESRLRTGAGDRARTSG